MGASGSRRKRVQAIACLDTTHFVGISALRMRVLSFITLVRLTTSKTGWTRAGAPHMNRN